MFNEIINYKMRLNYLTIKTNRKQITYQSLILSDVSFALMCHGVVQQAQLDYAELLRTSPVLSM